MSLETAIAELTSVVAANNELLSKMIARAESVKAPAAAPASPAAPPAASEEPRRRGRPPKAEQAKVDEQDDEDEAPVEAKPAPKAAPKKALTVDDIRESVGGFMAVEDIKVREERKSFVKAMLEHFGVVKAIEIPEEFRAQAIAWVDDYAAGKKVSFQQDDGDDDLMG